MTQKLEKSDKIVIFAALIMLLFFSYFLISKNSNNFLSDNSDNLGQIQEFQKLVKLKPNNEYFWLEIKQNNINVSNGDTVYTGPNSTVNLKFKNGSEIKLAENTLLKINFENNDFDFKILNGQIEVLKVSPKNKITINGKVSKTLGKISKTAVIATNQFSELIKVSSIIEEPLPPVTMNIEPPKPVMTVPVKKIKQKPRVVSNIEIPKKIINVIPPAIDTNESLKNFYFQSGLAQFLRLHWNQSTLAAGFFQIQLATDPQFTNIIYEQKSISQRVFLKSKLNQGQYFWRVQRIENDLASDWSNVGLLNIFLNRPEEIKQASF